jgi:hypothetical protein
LHSSTALKDFGYNFLGPICSEYFYSLQERCDELKPSSIGFLAREGYLFELIYQQLIAKQLIAQPFPYFYLRASRTFLFRISIADPLTWQWSLEHKFYGTLRQLLLGRFGFTQTQLESLFSQSELDVMWQLPVERKTLELHFNAKRSAFEKVVEESRAAYLDYLHFLGITASTRLLLCDVGYSGTIQKLLTRLLGIDTYGTYFITTEQGDYTIGDNTASMFATFKDKVKMGEGYIMLDRSLFLEALLTSPNGQFLDIIKTSDSCEQPFSFAYGREAFAQRNMQHLDKVFEGALAAVCHAFEHGIRYSVQEIEMLYEKFASQRSLLPRASWPLFDVDDAISGNGHVDPMRLFGL